MHSVRNSVSALMSRRPLFTVITLGVLFRLALFDIAPVHSDAGLFLYDALLAFQGQVPILDYYSRSPVFHYLLSGVYVIDYSPLVLGRLFMLSVSALLAGVIYKFTAAVYSEETGIAAAGVYLFTPFAAVWGFYIKTQLVAELFALIGIYVLVPHVDKQSIHPLRVLLCGSLFGAAFLIRRVVVVHVAALALFLLVYRVKNRPPIKDSTVHILSGLLDPVRNVTIFIGGAAGTLLLGYVIMGGPSNIGFLFEQTLIDLIAGQTSGTGGSGESVEQAGIISQVIQTFCQGCGIRTLKRLGEVILVTLPAMLVLLIFVSSFVRTYTKSAFQRAVTTGGMVVVMGLWAMLMAKKVTHFSSVGSGIMNIAGLTRGSIAVAVTGFGIAVLTVYLLSKSDPDQFDELWSRELSFLLLLLTLLGAAYLYRDRSFAPNYFLDFIPYVAILSGVGLVEIRKCVDSNHTLKRGITGVLIASFVFSLVISPFIAAPWGAIDRPYDPGTSGAVSSVQMVGSELEGRSDLDEPVFTTQPVYALEADRPVLFDLSRAYWPMTRRPDSDFSQRKKRKIIRALTSGRVNHVLVERFMGNPDWIWTSMFEAHPEIKSTVTKNYCPIETGSPAFEKLDVTLYRYSSDAPECNT